MLKLTDEILHEKMEDFDFNNPPMDPVELKQQLVDVMLANNGIGLSANQIGLPYRVFVMRYDAKDHVACFNPKIANVIEEKEYLMEEGCLSYPHLFLKIKRPGTIRVRFTDENGETKSHTVSGLTSRVFQHELDHMNGIDFRERAHKYHLVKAKKKQKTLEKRQKRLTEQGIVI